MEVPRDTPSMIRLLQGIIRERLWSSWGDSEAKNGDTRLKMIVKECCYGVNLEMMFETRPVKLDKPLHFEGDKGRLMLDGLVLVYNVTTSELLTVRYFSTDSNKGFCWAAGGKRFTLFEDFFYFQRKKTSYKIKCVVLENKKTRISLRAMDFGFKGLTPKKSLIMEAIIGFKFNFPFMSPFISSVRLTVPPAENSTKRAPTNLGMSLKTSPSTTMRAEMTQRTSSKPVKAISAPPNTSKIHDQRILELEDQINFLLKGSRPTPRPSSTHTPQAYMDAIYSNPHTRNQNEPTKQKSFTFYEPTGTNPQPRALGTTFEARVRDYMAVHTERMKRFENAISKQREEINDRMAKMCGLHRKLTTSRAPEKVLIREDAKYPVTKNVNFVFLTRREEEKSDKDDVTTGDGIEKPNGLDTEMPIKEAKTENGAENRIKNEPIKRDENEEVVEAPSSQPIGYYLKHRINEKLIE
ncbi:hypothetical protein Tco_1255959 [Tanacetum coccineum]